MVTPHRDTQAQRDLYSNRENAVQILAKALPFQSRTASRCLHFELTTISTYDSWPIPRVFIAPRHHAKSLPSIRRPTAGDWLSPLPRGPLLAAAGQGHRPPAPRAAEPSGDERPFERPLRPARCGGGRGSSRPKTAPRPQSPATTRHGGEGEAVASARRASARKGGDEPGRQRATEGRDGAAHAEPNPQPRRPSHGGEGDGGGGMAAASPKSQPPPLHGREGEEGARAEPHPRPRPPAIPASWRGGGGSSPASAQREGEGPGRRRATLSGAAGADDTPTGDTTNDNDDVRPARLPVL